MNPLEEAAKKILADKGIPENGDRALQWTVSYELFDTYIKPDDPTMTLPELPKLFGYSVVMDFVAPDTILLTEVVGYGHVPQPVASGG